MHFRAILVYTALQAMLLVLLPSVTLGQIKSKKSFDPNKSKKNFGPGGSAPGMQPKRPDAAPPGANPANPSDLSQAPPTQLQPSVPNVIIEEDLDARPFVVHAGKLPNGLPPWFKILADKNAQVPLLNWYRDGREIDDFRDWDRNNDGFITAEEALHRQRQFVSSADDTSPVRPQQKGEFKAGPKKSKGGDFRNFKTSE